MANMPPSAKQGGPVLLPGDEDTRSLVKSVFVVRRYATNVTADEPARRAQPSPPPPGAPEEAVLPAPGQLLAGHVTRHGTVFRDRDGDAGEHDAQRGLPERSPGATAAQALEAGAPPGGSPSSPPARQHVPMLQPSEADRCLPPVLPDEGPECGKFRLRAYEHVWKVTWRRLYAVLYDNHSEAFNQVLAVASQTAGECVGVPGAARLQTALVLAGGVNQADHAETFKQLADFLAGNGCKTASLTSMEVGPRGSGGGAAPPGLAHCLRHAWLQLAKGQPADSIPQSPTVATLCAWYNSTFGSASAAVPSPDGRSPGDPSASVRSPPPLVLLVEDTECCASEALADLMVALSENIGSTPVALVLGIATSPALVQALLPSRGANRLQQYVVRLRTSVDRLECIQREVLLGCGGGGGLPPELRLQPSASTQQQHTEWVRTMPLPLLDGSCASLLHARFVEHDFSLAALRDALQLAALLHASTCPLAGMMFNVHRLHDADATLVAVSEESRNVGDNASPAIKKLVRKRLAECEKLSLGAQNALSVAISNLSPPLRTWAAVNVKCLQGVPTEEHETTLGTALRNFGPSACAWGAAVACTESAAQLVHAAGSHGFGIRELFRDASRPDFVTSSEGKHALDVVLDRILDPAALPRAQIPLLLHQWSLTMRGCVLLDEQRKHVDTVAATMNEVNHKFDIVEQREKAKTAAARQRAAAVPGGGGGMGALDIALGGAAATTAAAPRRSSLGTGGGPSGAAANTTGGGGGAKQSERSRKEMRAMLMQHAASKTKEAEAATAGTQNAGDGGPAAAGGARHKPGSEREGLEANEKKVRHHARRVLVELIDNYLAKPPCTLPGSEVLVMSEATLLRGYLQAAPRATTEHALVAPGHRHFLHCTCCPVGPSTAHAAATMPDACAAYSLVRGIGAEFINVHDWFQDFIQLHSGGGGGGASNQPAPRLLGSKKSTKRKRGKHGAGATGGPVQPGHGSHPAPAAGAGIAAANAGDAAANIVLPSSHVSREKLWRLQARFERALAELRLVGLIRPAKKRRGEYVQVLVYGEDATGPRDTAEE